MVWHWVCWCDSFHCRSLLHRSGMMLRGYAQKTIFLFSFQPSSSSHPDDMHNESERDLTTERCGKHHRILKTYRNTCIVQSAENWMMCAVYSLEWEYKSWIHSCRGQTEQKRQKDLNCEGEELKSCNGHTQIIYEEAVIISS